MHWNKKYTCYKGKESEDCCNNRVEEALEHRTNIIVLIVGIMFLIIALTTRTASNKEFVNQVSFASTITSIILSVIAIWMSISGERSTNEIRFKVSNSVESLGKATAESGYIVNELKDTLKKQNDTYELMKNQMESMLSEIHGMKSSVDLLNSFVTNTDSGKKINTPNDLLLVFDNTIKSIGDEKMTEYLLDAVLFLFENKNSAKIAIKEMISMLIDKEIENGLLYAFIGIISVFLANGLFQNDENYKIIKEKYKR